MDQNWNYFNILHFIVLYNFNIFQKQENKRVKINKIYLKIHIIILFYN
jgi:hypothetical protein